MFQNLLQTLPVSAAGVEEFKDIFLECCGLDLETNPACVYGWFGVWGNCHCHILEIVTGKSNGSSCFCSLSAAFTNEGFGCHI